MSAHAERPEISAAHSHPDAPEAFIKLPHEELAALVEELEDSPFLRPTVRQRVLPKLRAAVALNPWAEPNSTDRRPQ